MTSSDLAGASGTPGAPGGSSRSWIVYAGLLVLFWGVWGATSSQPVERYDYPDEMIYIIWAFTMLVPAAAALRRERFDRRPVAALYGLLAGLTGAGGQLLLFQALADGPAYLIFPVVSLSPVITVLMAVALLRERIARLAVVGVIAAAVAIVLLSIPSGAAVTSTPARGWCSPSSSAWPGAPRRSSCARRRWRASTTPRRSAG